MSEVVQFGKFKEQQVKVFTCPCEGQHFYLEAVHRSDKIYYYPRCLTCNSLVNGLEINLRDDSN